MALSEKNIRNFFIYIFPKFVGYGMQLVTLPILTRILSPADFGVVTMTMLFATLGANVLTLGITSAAQRYYFEYKPGGDGLSALVFSTQLFLYLMLAVSSVIAFFFKDYIALLITGDAKYGMAVLLMFIAGYLGQVMNFYLYMYQNMEKASWHSAFNISRNVLTGALSLLFVWHFRMSYMGMIWASLAATAAVCLSMFVLFNRGFKFRLSGRVLLENIRFGLQIVPKSLTGFINLYFDKYMINNMLSLSAVGVYNIGQNVGNLAFVLMSSIWSSFQPVYYRDVFDRGAEASGNVGRMFTIFAYISLAPLLVLILFAGEALSVIAPPAYYGALDVIIIISAGVATQTFGMYVAVQYAYTKKAYWLFPITVAGTIVNVIANIILIPPLGLTGGAVSSALSTAAINVIAIVIGQRIYRIGYEWKPIAVLYALIALAIASALYVRTDAFPFAIVYGIKLSLIALYLFAGIKTRITTGASVRKVSTALLNPASRG